MQSILILITMSIWQWFKLLPSLFNNGFGSLSFLSYSAFAVLWVPHCLLEGQTMTLWMMATLIITGSVIVGMWMNYMNVSLYLWLSLNYSRVLPGCQSEETVDQPDKYVTELEGELITLDCKYTTSSTSQELFWYIQRTNESPKLVLQRNSYGGGVNGTEYQERFSSEVKPSKSVPLIMWRLRVSDSAVYYCALRPTVWTGRVSLTQNHKKDTCSRVVVA